MFIPKSKKIFIHILGVTLLIILCITLTFSTLYFYQQYRHEQQKLDLATMNITNLKDQIKILREEQLPIRDFEIIEADDTKNWQTKTDQSFHLTYKCPPKWYCNRQDGILRLAGPLEATSLEITIDRLDNTQLTSEVQFDDVTEWFEAAYNRNQKALQSPTEYRYSQVFYSQYQFKNMYEGTINNNKYLYFTDPNQNSVDILISKKPYVYRASATPNNKASQKTIKAIIVSLTFNE